MIIISYATKNTPYMKVIQDKLLPTLKKFNLKYDIDYPEDMGSWQANTHYKAQFIKKMLLKHKEPVVFLDADATIEKYPMLFFDLEQNKYDISYHELDWMFQWRKQIGNPKREVLSGTLYLAYTPIVLQFIDAWIEENEINNRWEQKNMAKVLKKWKDKLKVHNLPYSYITIMVGRGQVSSHMIKKEDVVILHWQASRRFRNWKKK